MKKGVIILVIAGLVLVLFVANIIGKYNSMQVKRINVDNAFAEIENQLNRRFDLIPNLVETVKGYASHETETFQAVTEARSRVGGVMQISDEILTDPEAFNRFQRAQNDLAGALQRLLVVTENYPELKANQSFIRLQDELSGTENRIAVARQRFNNSVADYNKMLVIFPNNMIANMFNFQQAQFFEAPVESRTAPGVQF